MAISAIIIDDEQYCIDSLMGKMQPYDSEVRIVATCTNASQAAGLLKIHKPALVFLDINLGSITAFDLLEKWPQPLPKIIFTTAYDHYAIKAFRYNAIDYLMKPVDTDELEQAIQKVADEKNMWPQLQQMKQAVDYLNHKTSGLQKIALPTLTGFELVSLQELLRLEAASNYTHFHLKDGRRITTSKTLKEYEELLEGEDGFVRIHQSHIINMAFLKNFQKGRTPVVTMADGTSLDVSATRRDLFGDKFKQYFKVS